VAGVEWIEIALKAGIALSGGIGGLFIGIWKWGRSSAKAEQAVKNQITALREEVRKEMAAHVQKIEDGHDDLVNHFEESFNGIRRQIDEHRYYTEKDFMKKDDFKNFREEYREDMRDLKASIAGIARTS
jgi:hypothetical protein